VNNPLPVKGLRYLAYLAFAVAALIFWALVYTEFLGFYPFPIERVCQFTDAECPPPSIWPQIFNTVVVLGTVPLTVMLFVFFRRWVRKALGLQDE